MVFDIGLDSDGDVHTDSGNDLALVTGQAQLEQSVYIDVGDVMNQLIGGNITATNISLVEKRIKDALNDDPQLDDVQSVTVEEFDKRTNTLTVTAITTENEQFEMNI